MARVLTVAPDTLYETDDEAQVTAWRLHVLLNCRVKVSLKHAELLAISHSADLHAVVRALERGCPGDLAVRIFFDGGM